MIAQCWRPWEMTTTANFPPGSIKAKLLDRLQRSRSDPCYFNEKVLCRSPYWRAQREWALALVDHRIVAVETGNMLGKGFLMGGWSHGFYGHESIVLSISVGLGKPRSGASSSRRSAGRFRTAHSGKPVSCR